MTESDPTPAAPDPVRERIEQVIATVSPLLDLVLAVGERISRIAEPVDYEYYPVRDPDSEPNPAETGETGDPAAL